MSDAKRQAFGIGMVTLVGYLDRNYPVEDGNCFDLVVDPPKDGEKLHEVYDRCVRRAENG